ncbi:S-adenosyl-L-methionine-dependent methyltransferase [Periconia macrospinosa]|uniref:S-adenosyl-L-methionine-dependent methyltransferase n=1 Tax=Periconia macrospinosa TaxID=97972 RepID=A0A2V1DI52_9PLEO|nr:S-adenosyl-L-methionine-dependent methyltransferase [Periconia macrospinosa]
MASDSDSQRETLINDNPKLQTYYHSLESRIGYRLLLGGTRHFGFYDHDTYWPFPLSRGLRRMEDKLAETLDLPSGAYVLDAGCGVGHVALHLAQKHGYRIQGIDIIDHHIEKARANIARSGLPSGQIKVRKMDYHHLDELEKDSFDGAYTMETFVHATDAKAVLANFHRVLRPGGRLSLFEYDHMLPEDSKDERAHAMSLINNFAAMPTNALSHPGVFQGMLEDAGFTDVVVHDYSENVKPMTRLFFILAYIPYLIVTLLHLERYFINTVAGVQSYAGHGQWRYVAISATKPGGTLESAKTR